VGPPETEGHEPGMQQTRMVGVLDVFLHQLPVSRNALARVTENGELPSIEHALDVGQDRRPDVVLDRWYVGMERRVDHAVVDRYVQLSERVIFDPEVLGHAALALQPTPKRYALELA